MQWRNALTSSILVLLAGLIQVVGRGPLPVEHQLVLSDSGSPEDDAILPSSSGGLRGADALKSLLPQTLKLRDRGGVPLLVVPLLLGFTILVLIMFSLVDFRRLCPGVKAVHEHREITSSNEGEGAKGLRPWSNLAIAALTSYRFYTGFLSATWMPYLLAMEGHELMGDRQSFFMGTAKLIYGLSILLNPIFGLVGDQMAVISHWSGRRLFILVGVSMGGLGIYGCLVAGTIESTNWYLAGVVLWMLGEAMADVTTETLVPELLPRSQYEISSAIRSMNFLIGGLAGYGALIAFRRFHYSWLYYAYLIVMLACAFLSLCFIDTEDLIAKRESRPQVASQPQSLRDLFTQAYIAPTKCRGGFPYACCALFAFSLGSAPMFFLYLIVRDIAGITNPVVLQTHFSMVSVVFFLAAAFGSTWSAVSTSATNADDKESSGPAARQLESAGCTGEGTSLPDQLGAPTPVRWRMMILSTIAFGVVCNFIPFIHVVPDLQARTGALYMVSMLFGMAFGSVYARFQECTWSILPEGIDIANAMGFAAMCKLAGVGIGNFIAGIILDSFRVEGEEKYQVSGYVIMCAFCSIVVWGSSVLTYMISRIATKESLEDGSKA